jgi:hypothetical protein
VIVSFAWTTTALLAGWKTVTRRKWAESHAAKFAPGVEFDAWNRAPYAGGRKVASCRVVSLRKEPLARILTDRRYGAEEIKKEGGLWIGPREFCRLFVPAKCPDESLETAADFPVYRLEFEIVATV